MKQTFYVYELCDGEIRLSSKKRSLRMENGTITLDVEPIRKEVEKVIQVTSLAPINPKAKWVNENVPIDAYDVKVTYKIKE
jgi:hypothetical protein